MGNSEHALSAYENALRHNPNSLAGLVQVAGIARIKEDYQKVSHSGRLSRADHFLGTYVIIHIQAIDYFQRVVELQGDNGEVWSSLGLSISPFAGGTMNPSLLGHCYLMRDELQKAYTAYQQALYLLPSPKVRTDWSRPLCLSLHRHLRRMIPSCGMALGSSTIVMDPWIMPKKHLLRSSG